MIVSHKHKFIFVKTTKTAGTSVEIALSEFLGEDDIITVLSSEDEALRREKGFRGAQNYNVLANSGEQIRLHTHAPIKRIRGLLGKDIFKSYYKVAIARNPWERAVSAYFYRESRLAITNKSSISFDKYVHADGLEGLNKRGWDVYTINDKIVVDEVLMYHTLNDSYKKLLTTLGIVSDHGLPFTKVAGKKVISHYSEMYNEKSIERVRSLFAKEIETFGFEFERKRV